MDPLGFAVNVGTAFLLGLLIGLERELRHAETGAGLRTNALVALGAALFVSLSRLSDHETSPTRVAGQVASGIGFLAGGVIIRDGFSVRGLATAATLWCTAAVGTLAGSGFPVHAVAGAAGVLLLHTALRPLALHLQTRGGRDAAYRLRLTCRAGDESAARAAAVAAFAALPPGFRLAGLAGHPGDPGERVLSVEVLTTRADDAAVERLAGGLLDGGVVRAAGWDRTG